MLPTPPVNTVNNKKSEKEIKLDAPDERDNYDEMSLCMYIRYKNGFNKKMITFDK